MNINYNYIQQKQAERIARIETYANNNNVPKFVAAMYVDEHAPLTTNKKMLEQIGYTFDTVTKDNYENVLKALDAINICVIHEGCSEHRIITTLNHIVTEEIPECWGGEDVKEYIDCFPDTKVLGV